MRYHNAMPSLVHRAVCVCVCVCVCGRCGLCGLCGEMGQLSALQVSDCLFNSLFAHVLYTARARSIYTYIYVIHIYIGVQQFLDVSHNTLTREACRTTH
jgi:hypothetical protein